MLLGVIYRLYLFDSYTWIYLESFLLGRRWTVLWLIRYYIFHACAKLAKFFGSYSSYIQLAESGFKPLKCKATLADLVTVKLELE